MEDTFLCTRSSSDRMGKPQKGTAYVVQHFGSPRPAVCIQGAIEKKNETNLLYVLCIGIHKMCRTTALAKRRYVD